MPTTECISPIELQFQGRRTLVSADGQQVSSDGGVILLRQVDERLGLTQRMSALLGAATRGHQRAELRPSLAGRAEHPRVANQMATGWGDDPAQPAEERHRQ